MSFMQWFHNHIHSPIPPTPGAQQSANFPLPPVNDHPYFNGMKDPVEGGFVTLEVAENARLRAIQEGKVTWARSVLPFRYAVQAAQSQPEFAMSDADKFSNEENCQYAKMFMQGMLIGKGWCPQAFIATPPQPGEHKLYDQGPALYGYASFDPTVTPDKLLAIFADALEHAPVG